MERRDFLRAAGTTTGSLLLAGEALGAEPTYPQPVDGTEAYHSKITTLKYPLAGVPSILEADDTLRVELAVEDPSGVEASLTPSFGGVDERYELAPDTTRRDASTIWTGETVTVAEFDLPPVSENTGNSQGGPQHITPDLYDLHVSWDCGEDHQPRAVRVYQSFPSDPKVAVIADPQIGDPRAVQAGAEEAGNKQTPEPILTRTKRTLGDGSADSRWNATQTAIDEVNLLDPDVVLIAGDLTFGQDAPGKYYVEYEEAWRVVNEIRAPTYTVLGNHDAYIQGGVDGKALYRETFAPCHYSVDVGDELHITALDTYDWNVLDRQGAGFAVSTYGGQVRDEQFAWLEDDLQTAADAGRTILALGHHNPSWQWDGDYQPADRTAGTPGLEQAGRGSRFFTTGQSWSGRENHFELRELFDSVGVSAYFSGHSHRDRLARTVPGTGTVSDVVETPGPRTPNDGQYHYVEYGDTDADGRPEATVNNSGWSQNELASTLENGEGTLYVNNTTSASSTGEYWGWRPLSVDTGSGEVTLNDDEFGYPATEAFLQDRAVNPAAWNPAHSEVGLYSHPSYLLEVEQVESTPKRSAVTVHNDLATPVFGAIVLSIGACNGVTVEGGEREWARSDGERTDVKVSFEAIGPDETRTIAVECQSN